ncbi:MAG: DoxX family protein [Chloroflexales bacterium]
MNIALWVLQVLMAFAFGAAGAMKSTQPIEKLSKSLPWTGEVSPGLVRFIGISELLGGIGLILPALTGVLPWLTPLAAACLALVMLLGAGFHVIRKEYSTIAPSVLLLLLTLFVAYGRFMLAPFV